MQPPAMATSLSSSVLTYSSPATIQRRPTLKRPRDDSVDTSIPSSPSKRKRVTIDSDVDIFSADDEDDIDPQLVRVNVHRAIQRHLVGDEEAYDRVKAVFSTSATQDDGPSTFAVRVHLAALIANVSSLKDCNDLVGAAIYTEWVGRDVDFCRLYYKFIGNLAAAQAGYTGRILHSLVELLGIQRARRVPDCKTVKPPRIHYRVLRGIQYLLSIVPQASGTLASTIQRKLKYDFAKPEERITYTNNFMDLIQYVPELQSDILAMITRELVNLDVSVQFNLDDEEDEVGEDIFQDLTSSQTLAVPSSQTLADADEQDDDDDDDEDGSSTEESDLEDESNVDPDELHLRKLKANVEQVDLLMDLLFRYYDHVVMNKSQEARDNAIEQLISHFNNMVLPTYRSRYTQFLIFHFAQTTSVLVDRFVTSCISILVDVGQQPVIRQSAAAYLGGFVGRGAHVSPGVVRDSFNLLCDELTALRVQHEPTCRGPDLKRYSNFYAIMQAILYIFCFRWRDLGTVSSDLDDTSDIEEGMDQYYFPDNIRYSLTSAINSKLNPLRVCTPVIVEQFVKLTHQLRFLYLYTKLEANKHVRLSSARRLVSDFGLSQPGRDVSWIGDNGSIDGYFPFDPYQLPRSKMWVEKDYVEWKGVPGAESEETESEEEKVDEDQEDNDDEEAASDEESL